MLSRAQEDRTLCLGALEPPGNGVPEVSGLRVNLALTSFLESGKVVPSFQVPVLVTVLAQVYIVMVREDAGGQKAAEHIFEADAMLFTLPGCCNSSVRWRLNKFLSFMGFATLNTYS